MRKLGKSAYNKAVAYLKSEARPLERARFAYHFENGTAADVFAALESFQNDDGGFGRGLESDIRLEDSSVIATTVAFQSFRECGVPSDHPMVIKACQYLIETYDADHVNWPAVPPNVDDAPHAPWWRPESDLEKNLINPRAEIAGYLNDYPQHFPAALREQVTEAVIGYLLEQPDEMEMHDLLCSLRLWETEGLCRESRSKIFVKLEKIAGNVVECDPESWKGYGLQPLAVVSTPDSPFAGRFHNAIEQNLDFIIETQGEQGSWMPNWSWGENWPDAWVQAQREWSGVLTLGNLRTLKAFGRIAV